LEAFAVAFLDPHLDHHGIARCEIGNVLLELLLLELTDYL
jgi:hypothetical protein